MSGRKKLRDGAKKPSPTKGGRNVEERLVNIGIVLEAVGLALVGNKNAISPELVNDVRCKAFCWEISYEGGGWAGQLGLIRGQRITPSPQQNDRTPQRQKTTSMHTDGGNTNDITEAVLTPSSRFAVTPCTMWSIIPKRMDVA
ncbi:hypothetical protein SEMRO_3194_G344960.1 [Seminavis robusta]|uniref:Uncharacterized protein n=1 Tax=Seminavis robusta TaxID=568900 RepID=A0A9N8F1T2_9STRA|nr:hypothetical protein SEMRO_3194_G344960.1 [Seminavis robusta]|eukprot:Sro3194_g344960.1 n/a (143) ;mRNA; r:4685-5113